MKSSLKFTLILFLLALLLLPSCSDNPKEALTAKLTKTTNITDPAKLKGNDWPSLFEEFWTVMNEDYIHFTFEDTDWDAVYKNYIDKFKALDYSKPEDSFKAFRLFNEIVWKLSDYHYHLTVSDNFGYTLDARPAVLQKWAATGGDIMDFPNIYTEERTEDEDGKITSTKTYYTVNNGPDEAYTSKDCLVKWNQAIDGYSEVAKLQENGAFHNLASTSSETFIEETYGEITKVIKDGNYYWNNLMVDEFGLEGTSWCTGVTNNGVLYIYFSQFVKPDLIYFCRYMAIANDKDVSEEEKAQAKENVRKSSITAYNKLDDEHKAQIDVIITLFKNLDSAVTSNSVTLQGDKEVPIKGIVLDLRCNGGGVAEFMQLFMGTFFASNKTLGYCTYKMGFSRYDITPWTEFNLNYYNAKLKEDYQGRLAVITNGRSISCSELATITSKLVPNSKRFGSTTYGGTCALMMRGEFHSGTYEDLNPKLSVRTTTFRYKAYDQTSYESHGIQPEVSVPLNYEQDDRFIAAVTWAATGEIL